jgi:hypothetical protein
MSHFHSIVFLKSNIITEALRAHSWGNEWATLDIRTETLYLDSKFSLFLIQDLHFSSYLYLADILLKRRVKRFTIVGLLSADR